MPTHETMMLVNPENGLTAAQVLGVLGAIVALLTTGFAIMLRWLMRVHISEFGRITGGLDAQTQLLKELTITLKASNQAHESEHEDTAEQLRIIQMHQTSLQRMFTLHDMAARGVNPSASVETESGRHYAELAAREILSLLDELFTVTKTSLTQRREHRHDAA